MASLAEALVLAEGFLAAGLVGDGRLVAAVFAADCARSLAATEDLGAPWKAELLKELAPVKLESSFDPPPSAVDATIAAGARRWIARLVALRPWIEGSGGRCGTRDGQVRS